MQERYNLKESESKWQKHWLENKVFEADDNSAEERYYTLSMFPYPSGDLHMGHVRNFSITDVLTRLKKSQGFNVLSPMGWDAFGLPAENAALENNSHPKEWTIKNCASMKNQMERIGFAIDWSREFASCTPDYYKHEQKFFLDFLKKGLAYKKEATVNWDPVDNCVLANEQVIDGKGWRSDAPVERRKLNQWFLKITAFADELLEDLKQLDQWPDKVRTMQENWIGKSKGLQFKFDIIDCDVKEIEVYTTRPDTLFGASFVAISPDHPLAIKVAQSDSEAKDFITECQHAGTSEAVIEAGEKKGYNTKLQVKHPLVEGKTLDVFIANFVLMEYGTGAIFGCPAHDQRDLDFARKYNLGVTPVILPAGENAATFEIENEAYTGEGALYNSEFLNDMSVDDAIAKVINIFEDKNKGNGTTNYRLRDWGVSRQRYWGCPVPVIYCDDCGTVPVPEDQLPVTLPDDVTFDKPGNPIDHHPTWKHTKCPTCGKDAERETDTFDTFFESSWYQFRFADPHNDETGFSKELISKWAPVDYYVGGIEHAVLHLLYARFFTKALKQCGYLDFDEPFKALFNLGMVTHAAYQDSDGKWLLPSEIEKSGGEYVKKSDKSATKYAGVIKMSKSKKNIVDPLEMLDNYGADAARLFVLSDSPAERDVEWTESGIEGAWKYINRIWRLAANADFDGNNTAVDANKMRIIIHKTIHDVTNSLEKLQFNKAIARIRELSNALEDFSNAKGDGKVLKEGVNTLLQLIAPITPHVTEEIWHELGNKGLIINAPWPKAEPALLVDDEVTIAVQINGKLRATINMPKDADKADTEKTALAEEKVKSILDGKTPKKVIVVPNRIVNVVI